MRGRRVGWGRGMGCDMEDTGIYGTIVNVMRTERYEGYICAFEF